jgi:hypothetical protein
MFIEDWKSFKIKYLHPTFHNAMPKAVISQAVFWNGERRILRKEAGILSIDFSRKSLKLLVYYFILS